MQTLVTDTVRWLATGDEADLLAWVADRSTTGHRHLVPVSAVGRTRTGVLVAEVTPPSGTVLVAALDRLGAPTTGVAVTLTLPLLELFVALHAGAVRIGAAAVDDVVVDDAGAVVLCDHPPGAERNTTSGAERGTAERGTAARRTAERERRPDARARTDRAGDDPSRTLVLAARTVSTPAIRSGRGSPQHSNRPSTATDAPPAQHSKPSVPRRHPGRSAGSQRRRTSCSASQNDPTARAALAAWKARRRGSVTPSSTASPSAPVGGSRSVERSSASSWRSVRRLRPCSRWAADTGTAPAPTRGTGAVGLPSHAGCQYPRLGAKLPSSRRFFTATR